MGKKEPDKELLDLINETADQLDNIMNVNMAQAAKDIVKKAFGRSVRTKDPMFWPAGMLMLGLVGSIDYSPVGKNGKNRAIEAIETHLHLWKEKYDGRLDFVDDALAGYAVIRLFEKSHNDDHGAVADQICAYIMDAPVDQAGSILYNPGRDNGNIFADGIGQATMFLEAYIRMKLIVHELLYEGRGNSEIEYYSESDYLNWIGKLYLQLANFYKYGRDPKSGLLYHGYSLVKDEKIDKEAEKNDDGVQQTKASKIAKDYQMDYKCEKKGLLGWGRAHGWLLMGLSCSASLEKYLSQKGKINTESTGFSLIPWYMELCRVSLEYQRPDGGWSWQLQAIDGHIDMSATGMIAYALCRSIQQNIIDEKSEIYSDLIASLKRARKCMLEHTHNGVVEDTLSSCDDFAVHYQTYGSYPWGQGAVLAALMGIEDICGE